MRVLGIETSTKWGSVALSKDGATISLTKWYSNSEGHLPFIVVAIAKVLSIVKERIEDLDLIGVSIGPGSYTGLRIGLASAKALSLTYNIPLKGVSSLKVEAGSIYYPEKSINVIRDAKRGLVYFATYRWIGEELESVKTERAISPDRAVLECEEGFLIGDGVEQYKDHFEKKIHLIRVPYLLFTPSADKVCKFAEIEFKKSGPDSLEALEPSYIRPAPPEENSDRLK